ncbi:hypothetical protein ACWDTT_11975 [Streptosporangium sandarakinum]|uniref:Uncharacterized protein n=1 Tax=Streptosporangium sandarakinum TaxID=1260955 RepID=A0A852V6M9_9ACTN|nr:hypothetical protein [Streptosporangium sandarakinum]NYF43806.1 hypothetical protein [Streptosporangium sandarakinum]
MPSLTWLPAAATGVEDGAEGVALEAAVEGGAEGVALEAATGGVPRTG